MKFLIFAAGLFLLTSCVTDSVYLEMEQKKNKKIQALEETAKDLRSQNEELREKIKDLTVNRDLLTKEMLDAHSKKDTLKVVRYADKIIDNFPTSMEADIARKYKARAQKRQKELIKTATQNLIYTKQGNATYYYDAAIKNKLSAVPVFLYIKDGRAGIELKKKIQFPSQTDRVDAIYIFNDFGSYSLDASRLRFQKIQDGYFASLDDDVEESFTDLFSSQSAYIKIVQSAGVFHLPISTQLARSMQNVYQAYEVLKGDEQ